MKLDFTKNIKNSNMNLFKIINSKILEDLIVSLLKKMQVVHLFKEIIVLIVIALHNWKTCSKTEKLYRSALNHLKLV